MLSTEQAKQEFSENLSSFVESLSSYISSEDGQWTVKGFIDVYRNIFTISSDTKIVSKILEIHLFPKILTFAEQAGYKLVLAEQQNYYPDFTFIHVADESIKFAVDLKTTYRLLDAPESCNGFTLGSHGEYFVNRTSTKNIQFPYSQYLAHFCLGIIYSRYAERQIDDTNSYKIHELQSIASVIKDFQFFVVEKWQIASDKSGSGNTANIGSITKISDLLLGKGMFSKLGEKWFDEYWMNYGKITIPAENGKTKKITSLIEFVKYKGGNPDLIVPKAGKQSKNHKNQS
jgi:Restriction endonuclease EcoRV